MCNHEAEQHLLGALLVDNKALGRIEHIVEEADFAWGVHGRIFAAIAGQIQAGRQANPVTLGHAFANDPARGGRYLMQLASCAVTVSAVSDYAIVVADLAIRRELIAHCEEFRPGETVLDVLGRLRPRIEAFANAIGRASNG
jgi:replicative DNA helicase